MKVNENGILQLYSVSSKIKKKNTQKYY